MEVKNFILAAALSGLAVSANATDAKKAEEGNKGVEGKCFEVNSCKGTSSCHSEANSCAGSNSCKGKGWLKMTEKACKEKKGKFKAL